MKEIIYTGGVSKLEVVRKIVAVRGLIGLLFDLLNGKIKIHWGRL